MVSDRQQADVQPVVDQAPQTARQEECESDGDQTEADQVPGAQIGELVLDHEEQDRSDDRPFERAESTDQHHEDQVGRPLHAEDRLRLNEKGVGQGQRSGGAATEAGQRKQDKLQPPDPDSQGSCGFFVVANGLERNAGAVAKQQEEEKEQQDREAERQPVGARRADFAGVDVQAAQ